MAIKAALLDERGIFLKIDTVKSRAALTERHVPTVTECDLPAGRYRWISDSGNPYGGAFWPLPKLKRSE